MPVRQDPTVLKRMVVRIAEKGGDLSRAFAIATAQAQRMGFLKAGTRDLTAKGREKEASYTRAQREEAEEALSALIADERPTAPQPKTRGKAPKLRAPKARGTRVTRDSTGLAIPGVVAAGLTDIGKVRTNNEDAFLVAPNLWVVSDGIGGADGGEIASRACVAGAKAALKAGESGPMLLERTVTTALTKMPRGFKGGATIVEATVEGSTLHVGNIGDSRAYLVSGPTKAKMKRLTRDHQERGNVLTRWVGPRSPKLGEVVLTKTKIEPGSRLLLCSDGVYGLISEAEIQLRVWTAPTPKDAAKSLVASALRAGGGDNATAVVVFFGARKTARQPSAAEKAQIKRAARTPGKPTKTRAPKSAPPARASGSLASMRPMLAKVFTGMKPGHSYVAEPKIDGYRLLAKRTASGVVFETRTGHSEPYTKNLRLLRESLAKTLRPGDVLDGEIIVGDWSGTGILRKDRPSPEEQAALNKNAVYWVFDMPSVTGPWERRREALINEPRGRGVTLVPAKPIKTVAEANAAAKKLAAAGYEGAIIKDTGALYSPGKRTDAFTKIKFKHDLTATITGFEEGTGKNAGSLGALRVRADGKDFKVGTGLSDAQRDDVWRNKKKYLGKKVEVTAQKDGAKLKLPRFPAFVRFRGTE